MYVGNRKASEWAVVMQQRCTVLVEHGETVHPIHPCLYQESKTEHDVS
jgi:hypothetical protein